AAASIYCINDLRQVRLNPYSNFMLVDIGGGSILIAIYKLSADGKPNELMEYSSNLCGSAYIDKEFIRYLCENFDLYDALQRLQTNNYDQLQYLAQEFCQKAKFSFTGDPSNFKPISIDLEDTCPAILKYVTGDVRDNMIDAEWIIELAFEDVKAMFDPVIQRINSHIGNHLVTSKNKCDAMFLVGGGSENLYLQGQIKLAFGQYFTFIESPKQPITAIVRGAVQYEIEKTKNIPRVVPSMYELNNLNSMKNFQNSSIGKSHGSLHSISPGSVHSMPPGSLHNIPPGSLQYEPGSLQYQPVKSAIIPNENVHNGLENKMDALLIQDWNPFTNPFKLGSRTLRYTYGVQVVKKWKKGDPPERKTPNGLMNIFYPLIKANTIVKVDQAVGYVARPSDPQQKDMTFNIYVSQEINPKYCDERGMRHFGTLRVDLSDMHLGKKRLIEFSLVFGMSEVKAEAKNKKTGMVYRATMKS
ncbi:2682_t:CDS:2, partial [Scutellospora calospora]